MQASGKNQLTVIYQPSKSKFKESKGHSYPKEYEKAQRTLLQINGVKDYLLHLPAEYASKSSRFPPASL